MTDLVQNAGDGTDAPDAPVPADGEKTFNALLVNTLISGVTSSFLWFALTFWVYLETRSIVTTGVIGGAFSLSNALLGPMFGTFVDRHRKKEAIELSTALSAASFVAAGVVFALVDADDLLRLRSPFFWLLVITTLLGSVAGMMRGIALFTCVTLLIPAERRDNANGKVGTIQGISFATTSVFSGLAIGFLGMGWSFALAIGLTVLTLVHLTTIHIDEAEPAPAAADDGEARFVDIRGAVTAIKAVRGLAMLIALAAFNNLLMGVFMALMDPYALQLVSVETWGFVFGVVSIAMIVGGTVVARRGLGPNPVRVIIVANLVNWAISSVFTLRSSIVLLGVGMFFWMALMPFIEAAEQTVLQKRIPFERQGRVFGFAQLVENATAPLTAFLMAPLAEAVFIPAMTDGWAADAIGSWFGTGIDRGIALMFTIAGLLGLVITLVAWSSRSYRFLSAKSVT